MRRARSVTLAVAATLLLPAAGCGDDGEDPAETGTTQTTQAPADETTTTEG
jgi:hypothetical protein